MERTEKLHLRCPVAVEGKYDKIKLDAVVDTPIIVLNGFSVFRDEELRQLLRRIVRQTGLILLTDSDRAGSFLRARLKSLLTDGDLPENRLWQVYAPPVRGKEKRKTAPSADGLLGIEGTDTAVLRRLLLPFADVEGKTDALPSAGVSKAEWFADGFSGGEGSADRRRKLAAALDLPLSLSGKALLEAVNLLVTREQYEEAKQCLENASGS